MRTTLALTILLTVSSAFAFNMPNLTFPKESGWAKAMTQKACKQASIVKSDKGTIEDAAKGGVIYTVYSAEGSVKAQAWAKSTFIGASKKCMIQ